MGGKSVAIINHPDVRRNLMIMKTVSEGLRAMITEAGFYDIALVAWDEDGRAILNVFTIEAVTHSPEPSTLVLIALGSVSLLPLRRRFGEGRA